MKYVYLLDLNHLRVFYVCPYLNVCIVLIHVW